MLKPKPRLCPERSERASISRASGSWAANAFSRLLRRISSHPSGSKPNKMPVKGIRAGWTRTKAPRAIPSTANTTEITVSLLEVRLVSACSKSSSMLPNRSTNDSKMPGLSSNGWERMLAVFGLAVLGGRGRADAGQHVEAVFDLVGRFIAQQQHRAAHQGGDSHKRQDRNDQDTQCLVLHHDPFPERAGRQADAGRLEPRHERRPDARGHELAVGPAVLVHPFLVVSVHVLHHDGVLFHADDFGDAGDFAGAALEPAGLHDHD